MKKFFKYGVSTAIVGATTLISGLSLSSCGLISKEEDSYLASNEFSNDFSKEVFVTQAILSILNHANKNQGIVTNVKTVNDYNRFVVRFFGATNDTKQQLWEKYIRDYYIDSDYAKFIKDDLLKIKNNEASKMFDYIVHNVNYTSSNTVDVTKVSKWLKNSIMLNEFDVIVDKSHINDLLLNKDIQNANKIAVKIVGKNITNNESNKLKEIHLFLSIDNHNNMQWLKAEIVKEFIKNKKDYVVNYVNNLAMQLIPINSKIVFIDTENNNLPRSFKQNVFDLSLFGIGSNEDQVKNINYKLLDEYLNLKK